MKSLTFSDDLHVINVFPVPKPYMTFSVFIKKPQFYLKPHLHPYFHLNYITDGSVDVITSQGVKTARAGSVFIMPPGVEHALSSESGYAQRGVNIADCSDDHGIVRKLHEICGDNTAVIHPEKTDIRDIITVETLTDRTPLSVLRCTTGVTDLILRVIDAADLGSRNAAFRSSFQQAVQEYDGKSINLNSLCKTLGFSKTHLERLTKQEFGCSTVEYFDRMRYAKICSQLVFTDKTLAAIAEECGFCDSSHLSVFFKKRSGMTCMKYRNLTR